MIVFQRDEIIEEALRDGSKRLKELVSYCKEHGVSRSTCHRRLRHLVEKGVVKKSRPEYEWIEEKEADPNQRARQYSVQPMRSKNGVDGILFLIDGEVVIKYDISQNYKVQNKMLEVKLEEEYDPKKYSNYEVGINNARRSKFYQS